MSLEQTIKKMLLERGLFENQCDEIFTRMKDDPTNEAMRDRWSDDTDGYPQIILSIAWFSARTHALKYIDENCPQAWFRPVFENDPED